MRPQPADHPSGEPPELFAVLNLDDLDDLSILNEPDATIGDQRLLAVLLVLYSEVYRTGVLVAASSTVANALLTGIAGCTNRSLLCVYPRERGDLLKGSVRIRKLFPLSPLRRAMETFHQNLSRAKQASLRTNVADFARTDWGPAHLAETWRVAAAKTAVFLQQLQEMLQLHDVPPATSEHEELMQNLLAVTAGACPMLDEDGEVQLPCRLDRRQADRARLWAPAILSTATDEHAAIIRDMSATGLGLECTADLPSYAAVSVSVGPSLRLDGTVVWSDAGRAGVRLSAPLTGANPFFKFCARLML